MRTAPLMAIGIAAAAVGFVLTGCASNATTATPGSSAEPAATPSPTPTIEPIVVGPAEMPPLVFGGDCGKALTTADLFEAVGVEFQPDFRDEDTAVIANVGGLRCTWREPGGGTVYLNTIPQAGLDGTVFPADEVDTYFVECPTTMSLCAWQDAGEPLWTSVTFASVPGMTRELVDGWGERLAQRVTENHAATAAEPWTRDRTGWWPAFDCEQIANAVAARSAAPVVLGEVDGFRPAPGQVMAIRASRETNCGLSTTEGTAAAQITAWSGMGALTHVTEPTTPVESGAPGISMFRLEDAGSDSERYVLSDGVNAVLISVYEEWVDVPEQLAVAIAAAAASDFQ